MATSIIKNPNPASIIASINFANNPTTYFESGLFYIYKFGRIVILRFVDIRVRNSPTTTEIFYSGIPESVFTVTGVLVSTFAAYGSQKIYIEGKNIKNYYSADAQRNGQTVSGQLVYFSKE